MNDKQLLGLYFSVVFWVVVIVVTYFKAFRLKKKEGHILQTATMRTGYYNTQLTTFEIKGSAGKITHAYLCGDRTDLKDKNIRFWLSHWDEKLHRSDHGIVTYQKIKDFELI